MQDIDAQIVSHIDSITNPISGKISASISLQNSKARVVLINLQFTIFNPSI